METAFNEITLVLFTTLGPAGAVGFIVMALAAFAASRVLVASADGIPDEQAGAVQISRYLVIPLAFAITGLIASATHLGTPANALFVLTGIGRSPLSNEVVAAAVFLALGGSLWIASFYERLPRVVAHMWLAAAAIAALAFVGFVAAAYSVETVPTWNLPFGPITLVLGGIASGSVLGLLGISLSGAQCTRAFERGWLTAGAACALACAAVLMAENAALADIRTVAVAATDLVPWLPGIIVAFIALQAACFVFASWSLRAPHSTLSGEKLTVSAIVRSREMRLAFAELLSLAACFLVRFAFYAMHITIGL